MAAKFRWGILAPGRIAHAFAKGVGAVEDAEIHSVGSRSIERATEFADRYSAPKRHGSYEALVSDPDVDAIYVASPHPFHEEHALLCLNAGKPVLCEKPFCVNVSQADRVIATARSRKVFCMEAMWTRFLPMMQQVRAWIDDGRIGDVRMIRADFSFRSAWNPDGRLLNPALAGGGLLDVGVYVVSLASFVMRGQPENIASVATIGETGVDEQAAITFSYDSGAVAALTCGIRTSNVHTAAIYGTDGYITIPPVFWRGTRAELVVDGKETETVDIPHLANGYEFEAMEVMRCVRDGRIESDTMPLAETRAIVETMDRIRRDWGLAYPFENQKSRSNG